MILPVPVASAERQTDDSRDLVTAMRLLSGKDCKRDPSQAQVLLVRLSESRDKDIATDARNMLKVALADDWFDDKTPHFFELERIAEKSLEKRKAPKAIAPTFAIGVGLFVLLIGGVVAFSLSSGGTNKDPPWILVSVIAAMIAAGFAVFMFRQR